MNPKTANACCIVMALMLLVPTAYAQEKAPTAATPAVTAAPTPPAPAQPVPAEKVAPAPEKATPPAQAAPAEMKSPKRDMVLALRLDALGISSGNILYGTTSLLYPQVKLGFYAEPFAARLILGYTRITQSTSYSGMSSSSYDQSQDLFTLGGEASYYFTPIATSTLATYGVFRVAKLFLFEDNSRSSGSSSSDDTTAPLLFGLGFGAEWCFTERFSLGLETGLQLGYTSSDSGSQSSSTLLLGFPYGIFTANAYFF